MKTFFAGLLFTLTALFLAMSFAQPQPGGVLRAGMQTDPVGLDPHTTSATSSRNMLENVYDTLVMFDSEGRVVPGLAESWETSPDGLIWTFALREGVTFHNGDSLSAADVAFSINRIKDPEVASPNAGDFEVVADVSAPDEATVVFTLSEPYSPLLSKLANSLNVVVSQAVVEENGNLDEVVVGTGPFRFVEYLPQTRMVLEKYDAYWGTDENGNALPYLDGVTFTFYPDPTARTTALVTDNVDWIEYVPAADLPALQTNPDLAVVGGLSANFRSLYLNPNVEPLNNVQVRQAIAYAVNEQSVVDLALFGTGGVAATGTTIPANSFYAVSESPYTGQDLERARELLAEAGFAEGFDLELYVTSTYDFLRTPAEVIQADLAQIGIRVNIRAEDWSIYLPTVLEGNFTSTILGESGQSDPDDYLYTVFHTDAGGNFASFSDAELDGLLEEGRRVSGEAERKAIYDEAQARVLELAPQVFLFHSAQYEAHSQNVGGFEHFPNTSYLGLRTTYLEP